MATVPPATESEATSFASERMLVLDQIKLAGLRAHTHGNPDVRIALIDGPVAVEHEGLERKHLVHTGAGSTSICSQQDSMACLHGTFIAGVLAGNPNTLAPSICPNCTLMIRPIFTEMHSGRDGMPSATSEDLATAIQECLDANARIVNLSLGLAQPSSKSDRRLEEALNHALKKGAVVVAAAGNQGTLGTSVITRHPWVIPVVASDLPGRPIADTNLAASIGKRGLSAPGDRITSLCAGGGWITLSGTSVAVPFVTGAIALLWSEYPSATSTQIKLAVLHANGQRRFSVVPPLLDAAAAWEHLRASQAHRWIA